MRTDYSQLLQQRFGLSGFYAWQREVIEELLHGSGKVMLIAPTGGGKSLCYQFPAAVLEGTSIIVSPLIALMEDQVRSLSERGIAATYLASTLDEEDRRSRELRIAGGGYQIVYVAPERLLGGRLLNLLATLGPPLVAIDEAHCISQWGHDFRPSYLRLTEVLEKLRPARVLACTATATPIVREEIQQRLGLTTTDTAVILRGFSRPNLHLEVIETDSTSRRRTALLQSLQQALGECTTPSGGAIVYAATRRNTEMFASLVQEQGWRTAAYHAGLEAKIREAINRRFAEKELDVIVATNAFGMGIDRDDIRAVIHVQAPGSVEAYYQEVGRAGRDGQPAHGVLIASSADYGLRRRLIGKSSSDLRESNPDPAHVERQWRLFLDLMSYVEAGSCRHDFILRYFGDEREMLGGCGHCDVCMQLEEKGDARERAISDEDALIVRKALAGIARNRGRAGLNAVADMLHGKDTERLRNLGLLALTTHGILRDRPKSWILALLRRLMTAGLVSLSPSEFPVPFLTQKGIAVMQGHAEVRVFLPSDHAGQGKRQAPKKARADLEVADVDRELFDALRAVRLELARERGVPAYVICHDRTLIDMTARQPKTLRAMAQVHGMGPARLDQYGPRFLSAIDRQ